MLRVNHVKKLTAVPTSEANPGADFDRQSAGQALAALVGGLNASGLAWGWDDLTALTRSATALEALIRCVPPGAERRALEVFVDKYRRRDPLGRGAVIDIDKLRDALERVLTDGPLLWIKPVELLTHGVVMGRTRDGSRAVPRKENAPIRPERVRAALVCLSGGVLSVYRDAGFRITMTPETAEELQCLAAQGDRKAVTVLCNVRVEPESTNTGDGA